jgi:site-specific DNA-methyltransferase (adenine-specific)
MTPYYEHAGIVIYHGDCREILPGLPKAELLLTDPPYGMKYKPLRGSDGSKRFSEPVVGDDKPFDPAHLLRLDFKLLVLFGANWYADKLPASGGWLVWDKTPRGAKNGFAAGHAELAWTNFGGSVQKFSEQWGGEAHGAEEHWHPTQKPVPLLQWCICRAGSLGTIVDPYMGSGSTLIAARLHGNPAIGIEIEEKYCEAAATRLSQQELFTGVQP